MEEFKMGELKMNEVQQMIRALHVSGKYMGVRFLAKAIEIIADDESTLICVSKLVYPTIAQQYKTTVACVERNIRTVVEICWREATEEQLTYIMGYVPKTKPTSKAMLDAMAVCVRELRKKRAFEAGKNKA